WRALPWPVPIAYPHLSSHPRLSLVRKNRNLCVLGASAVSSSGLKTGAQALDLRCRGAEAGGPGGAVEEGLHLLFRRAGVERLALHLAQEAVQLVAQVVDVALDGGGDALAEALERLLHGRADLR